MQRLEDLEDSLEMDAAVQTETEFATIKTFAPTW